MFVIILTEYIMYQPVSNKQCMIFLTFVHALEYCAALDLSSTNYSGPSIAAPQRADM